MPLTIDNTVIEKDFCIGCGSCAFIQPEKYSIGFDQYGMLKAEINNNDIITSDIVNKVCPFSNNSKNEDELSDLFFKKKMQKNNIIGSYNECYVGHVQEGDFRKKGSSGGLAKWILYKLLEKGKVDYVIQVKSEIKKGELFSFSVFDKKEDIIKGAKSAYYPVTLLDALEFMRNNEGRYAISAIPCFSKALRNISLEDEVIKKRIEYIVGIFCGHMKSTAFAELFSWQLGVAPGNMTAIDFRGKLPGRNANDKGVQVKDTSGHLSKEKSSKELFGGNWGHNLFKYKACDYCDDIVAETADVAIGDAWLPEFIKDHQGASIVITRSQEIEETIKEASSSGELAVDKIEPDRVIASQIGGVRHRREGLAFRLFNDRKSGYWFPIKRVKPSDSIPGSRKRVYNGRVDLRIHSHKEFLEVKNKDNGLMLFEERMGPFIKRVEPSVAYKMLRWCYRKVKMNKA